jgi:hypothetical protein
VALRQKQVLGPKGVLGVNLGLNFGGQAGGQFGGQQAAKTTKNELPMPI